MKRPLSLASIALLLLAVSSAPAETVFHDEMDGVAAWSLSDCAFEPNGDGTATLTEAGPESFGKVSLELGVLDPAVYQYLELRVSAISSSCRLKIFLAGPGAAVRAIEDGWYTGVYLVRLSDKPDYDQLVGQACRLEIWIEGEGASATLDSIAIRGEKIRQVYVSPNGSDTPPYLTWATAARSIQAAVYAAEQNGSVVVTNGVYSLNQAINLAGAVTVRSVNGPEETIAKGEGNDCCFRIYGNGGAPSVSPILDGLTIRNGYAEGGAGVLCMNGGTLTNCIISYNTQRLDIVHAAVVYSPGTFMGGGVACQGLGAEVRNCTIKHNVSREGGGVICRGGGSIVDCTIVSNIASWRGGGIAIWGVDNNPSAVNITRCLISDNISAEGGGLRALNATIEGCRISRNTAACGGGAYLEDSTRFINNLVQYNTSSVEGGGLYACNLTLSGGIQGCTIVSNRCTGPTPSNSSFAPGKYNGSEFDTFRFNQNVWAPAGGAYLFHTAVKNCIIYDNLANGPGDNYTYGPTNEWNDDACTTPNTLRSSISNTCTFPKPACSGDDCISSDPLFVDRAAGQYALQAGSPCIDFGSSYEIWSDVDLTGVQRPLDGNNSGTAEYDIGAYEYVDPLAMSDDADSDGLSNELELYTYYTDPYQADTDEDGLTDYQEVFTSFTNPNYADIDRDGFKDGEEFLNRKTDPYRYNGRVFAHFMPWFGDNDEYQQLSAHEDVNAAARVVNAYHWRDGYATNGHPIIGRYSSRDPAACEYHILAALACELDGFILNWRGTNGAPAFLDDGAWLMFNKLQELKNRFHGQADHFSLCSLNYDDQPYLTPSDFSKEAISNDFAYLKRTYVDAFPNEYYRLWNGESWQSFMSIFITHGDDVYRAGVVYTANVDNALGGFIAWPTPADEIQRYADSFYAWVQPDNGDWAADGSDWGERYLNVDFYSPIRTVFSSKQLTIGGAWAGFDDRQVNWYAAQYPNPSVGEPGNRWMDRRGLFVFTSTWALAEAEFNKTPPVRTIQVITWNDWNEGTAIEPSGSSGPGAYGYQYADALRDRAANFRSRRETNDALGVRLARKIYFARKTSADPAFQATIDTAVGLFLQADYAGADSVLNGLGSPIQYEIPAWNDDFSDTGTPVGWNGKAGAEATRQAGQLVLSAPAGKDYGGAQSPELLVDLDAHPILRFKLDALAGLDVNPPSFKVQLQEHNSSVYVDVLTVSAPGTYEVDLRPFWTGTWLFHVQLWAVDSLEVTARLDFIKLSSPTGN